MTKTLLSLVAPGRSASAGPSLLRFLWGGQGTQRSRWPSAVRRYCVLAGFPRAREASSPSGHKCPGFTPPTSAALSSQRNRDTTNKLLRNSTTANRALRGGFSGGLIEGGATATAASTTAATAPVLSQKSDSDVVLEGPAFRRFSTASALRLRLWLAGAPKPAALWRQVLGWGPMSSVGLLQELQLPRTAAKLDSMALGGCGVLVVSEGRLLGAPLVKAISREGPSGAMELQEMRTAPPEEVGVALGDLRRHLRASEAQGVPVALGGTANGVSRQNGDGPEEAQFVKVAAGLQHSAAVTSHGVLYTWGRGGAWGAGSPLGHGDSRDRSRPTPVAQFIAAGEFVVDVACGAASTCVVTSTGRVFSSGAADFGLNGSGMLLSSKVFRELESFRRSLSPDLLAYQRRNEEEQLRELEALREEMDRQGHPSSRLSMRPFEALQASSQDALGSNKNNPEDTKVPVPAFRGPYVFPRVVCGAYHCGLLTGEGDLWLWGRSDCMQLSQEKPVMASGGESNYPILAQFFTRANVRLESCALGPSHSLAVARNGMVYEWGGAEAASPHLVDLHCHYPESIFKSCVTKVACGGTSTSAAFSAALTGASMLPLDIQATDIQTPVRVSPSLFGGDPTEQSGKEAKVVDISAGPQGCLILIAHSHGRLRPK